ncbi:MAG: 50S ribosomal protein L28 [Christensenellales bacterium]|jgi:large subunit ribosomal protein L28|nr:50S ribosomal protein L28 [Clostridiales bacterium]
MARKCSVCGKGPMSGNKVSHSNIKTRKSWSANLHKVKDSAAGEGGKYICTRCMRTERKNANI